jgi:hypothetical protein
MTLGDRVAVMRNGRIEQFGPPLEIYRRPRTAFVGSFLGAPAMNLVSAHVDEGALRIGTGRLGVLVWGLPVIVLLLGGGGLVIALRRWRTQPVMHSTDADEELVARERRSPGT